MDLKRIVFYSIGMGFLLLGCREKKDKKYVSAEDIYLDYRVTANDGDDNLTIKLQFLDANEGNAVELPEPASVSFDGEPMMADSTKLGGFFYEIHRPIAEFTGTHDIIYTDINKKQYREEFDFKPLVLNTSIPDTISSNEFQLSFSGIEKNESVELIYRDTSFNKEDLRRKIPPDGKIKITNENLQGLETGPVQFDFVKEYKKALKSTTAGGKLVIVYTIRREVFLKKIK